MGKPIGKSGMSEISKARGKQVSVGDIAFILPELAPETDDEIIEREDLIARIEKAMDPYAEQVKWAKSLINALRNDISKAVHGRLLDEQSGQMKLPLEDGEAAESENNDAQEDADETTETDADDDIHAGAELDEEAAEEGGAQ